MRILVLFAACSAPDHPMIMGDGLCAGMITDKAAHPMTPLAKSHTIPSPRGTRAVFASDWGGGDSVDSYVLELPGYQP
jgi:hypothetical protein